MDLMFIPPLLLYGHVPCFSMTPNKMKHKSAITFTVLASLLTIQNCEFVDEANINAVCNSDCTTIQGRFTTEDDKPIKDMPLEMEWSTNSGGLGLGGKTRKIMTGETNDSGNYTFVFYANDEELSSGSFSVKFTLPDETYLILKDYSYFQLSGINKRDTLVIGNYHVPRKGARIKLIIKNPGAISGDDQLVSSVSYKYDLNKNIHFVPGELFSMYSSEATMETATNQFTYIKTSKRINGQYVNLIDSVVISSGQIETYEVTF